MPLSGLPGYAVILTERGSNIYGSNYPDFNQTAMKSQQDRDSIILKAIQQMQNICLEQKTIAQEMITIYGVKDFDELIKKTRGKNTNTIEKQLQNTRNKNTSSYQTSLKNYRNKSNIYYEALGELQLYLSQTPNFIYKDAKGLWQINNGVLDNYIKNLGRKQSKVAKMQKELAEELKQAEYSQQSLENFYEELAKLAESQLQGFQLDINITNGQYSFPDPEKHYKVMQAADALLKILQERAIELSTIKNKNSIRNKNKIDSYLGAARISSTTFSAGKEGSYVNKLLKAKNKLIKNIAEELEEINKNNPNYYSQKSKDAFYKEKATQMANKLMGQSAEKFSEQIIHEKIDDLASIYITSSLGTNVGQRQGNVAELTTLGFNNKEATRIYNQIQQHKDTFDEELGIFIEKKLPELLERGHTAYFQRNFTIKYDEDSIEPLSKMAKGNHRYENIKRRASKFLRKDELSRSRDFFMEEFKQEFNLNTEQIEAEMQALKEEQKLYRDLQPTEEQDKIDQFFQVLDASQNPDRRNYYIAISNKRRNGANLSSIGLAGSDVFGDLDKFDIDKNGTDLFHSLDLLTQNGTENSGDLLFAMLNQSTASIYHDKSEQEEIKKYVENLIMTKFFELSFNPENFVNNLISNGTNYSHGDKVLYVLQVNQTYIPSYVVMDAIEKKFFSSKSILEDVVRAQIQFDTVHRAMPLWYASFARAGIQQGDRWAWVANQVAANTSMNVDINIENLFQFFHF